MSARVRRRGVHVVVVGGHPVEEARGDDDGADGRDLLPQLHLLVVVVRRAGRGVDDRDRVLAERRVEGVPGLDAGAGHGGGPCTSDPRG